MALFQEFNPIKKVLLRSIEQLSFIGIDINRIFHLRNLPRFFIDRKHFKQKGGKIDSLVAALADFDSEAGTASGHYFHQDLLVAKFIYQNNPANHFDFGSRIDGFVSHVASFRKITVLDKRPLTVVAHPEIEFKSCDVMNLSETNIADSLSCLHTIEHIGLGRYGDHVDPNGHILAFNNLLNFLKKGGVFYLSFPISNVRRTLFNRERIFQPTDILNWGKSQFEIDRFDFIDDQGALHLNHLDLNSVPKLDYGCGIFTLRKL